MKAPPTRVQGPRGPRGAQGPQNHPTNRQAVPGPPRASIGVEEDHGPKRSRGVRSRPSLDERGRLRSGAQAVAGQDRGVDRRGGLAAGKIQTARSLRERVELADKGDPKMSARKQCRLLKVSRSSVDCRRAPEREEDRRVKRLPDETAWRIRAWDRAAW